MRTRGAVGALTPFRFLSVFLSLGHSTFEVEVSFLGKGDPASLTLDSGELSKAIKAKYQNHVYVLGQKFALQFKLDPTRTIPIGVTVRNFDHIEIEKSSGAGAAAGGGGAGGGGGGGGGKSAHPWTHFAQLHSATEVTVVRAKDATFKLTGGASTKKPSLFEKGFNFEALGIGGLDKEFQSIFRQTFTSRLLPPAVVQAMGQNHVRGMLLYGPPGCGKTLIARQIGKALHAHEPKVVNGPEVLNKFVGQSEENVRLLFADAEKEQAEKGDDSDLHIIILDEIDAICRKRGTVGGGTGVHDSVVNQLLSKIDGVEALNNVLIIGMTNRKDMIDEALLRPGRLEVHVEIGLPDEAGRVQILTIHTKKIRDSGFMASDVDLEKIAALTKNFTGAELARVVRNARSFAISRVTDLTDLTKAIDIKAIKITHEDFVRASEETHPAFGADDEDLRRLFPQGIISHGPAFDATVTTLERLVRQIQASDRIPVLSACVAGVPGSGKSALVAKVAVDSGFPLIKRLGAEDLLGMPDVGKSRAIHEFFEDAYKSPLALIILDDIERMLDYVPMGPNFSNAVLQTLIVLLRRPPTTVGRRIIILATTSEPTAMEDLGLMGAFTIVQHIPVLRDESQFAAVLADAAGDVMSQAEIELAATELAKRPHGVPIKRLLTFVEMAIQAERDESSSRSTEGVETPAAGAGTAAAGGAGGAAGGAGGLAKGEAGALSRAGIVLTADRLLEVMAESGT